MQEQPVLTRLGCSRSNKHASRIVPASVRGIHRSDTSVVDKRPHLLLELLLRCSAAIPQRQPLAGQRVHGRQARRSVCIQEELSLTSDEHKTHHIRAHIRQILFPYIQQTHGHQVRCSRGPLFGK